MNLREILVAIVLVSACVYADVKEEVKPAKEAEKTEPAEAPSGGEGEKSAEIEVDNGVLVLTDGNFDTAVAQHPTILVEFYAPWCGHCKSLAPKYETAANMLIDYDPPIKLAKVDATVHNEVASRFGVSGYPTLKFFKNGVAHEYAGPRDSKGIVDYMKDKADPSWTPPPSKVLILTQANFTDFIQNSQLALVEFFAPWCGHCKRLAPEYEKAARDLADQDPPIALATVDATVETDLASTYGVKGYPTLKVFRKGRVSDFDGGRTHEEIVSHMISQVGEGSRLLDKLTLVKEFMAVDDITVGAFFENDNDVVFKAYLEAASDLRNEYKFFHTFSPQIRDAYKVNFGSVVVFNAERFYTEYENKWHVLEKSTSTRENMVKFIEDHKVPLVGELTESSDNSRYKDKRPLCIFFYTVDFSFDHRALTQLWRTKIAKIAKDFRDVTFVVADDGSMTNKMSQFNLQDSNEEINVGCYGDKDKRYRMEEFDEFEPDEIVKFIKDMKKDRLKPVVRSQKPPKKQESVLKVVGSTFKDLVSDSKKDVLLMFYKPGCPDCVAMDPILKDLAKSVKDLKIVVAKIDGSSNEYPNEFTVYDYPTIFYVSAADKNNPIQYKDERKLEDLKKFVTEQTKGKSRVKEKTELYHGNVQRYHGNVQRYHGNVQHQCDRSALQEMSQR